MTQRGFTQVLTVQVPSDTKWQPQVAVPLMVALFALPHVTLAVRAEDDYISWQIETPRQSAEAVTRAVHGLYPQAQVDRQAKSEADVGFHAFLLEAVAPFYVPLVYAADCHAVDPLSAIVSAMGALADGEAMVYSLVLNPPTQNYQRLGQQQITRPTHSWLHFLSPQMALQALFFRSLFGVEKRQARFVSDLQRLAEHKVRAPVKEVQLMVKIRASSAARAAALYALLQPAFAQFASQGANALATANYRTYPLVLAAAELAALWHLPSDQCQSPYVRWATHLEVPLPRELSQAQRGIRLGTSRYQGKVQEVWLDYPDRTTHINLIGRTRTGKSTLLHNMVRQDIAAGHGVGVIDPHGDLVDDILACSIPTQREQDVVLFDLGDSEQVIGLNLLAPAAGVPVESAAAMALAVLQKFFIADTNLSRMEDTLYAALVSLMSMPGSVLHDIPRLFFDDGFRSQVISQVENPVALDYWFSEFEPSSASQRLELARPVNHRIRRLYRSQHMSRILGTTDCLDFAHLLAQRKILLANLRGAGEGDTLGALLLSKLQMAAMGRAQPHTHERPPFYLYVDEVQNYITSSLSVMLSEAAKYGLSLVIANQFLGQLEGKTLKAVLGNIGTNVIFRTSKDDAETFGSLVQPAFRTENLIQLDRFRAVVKTQQNGKTLPAFMLATDEPPPRNTDAAERAGRIRACSRQAYGRPAHAIDAELLERARRNQRTNMDPSDPLDPMAKDYFD